MARPAGGAEVVANVMVLMVASNTRSAEQGFKATSSCP